MKKILLLLLLPILVFAQKNKDERRENIRNAKVGMITNRLNLTTEQAPKFWVIYNDYEREIRDIRQKIKKITEDASSLAASDEKIAKNINQILDLRQEEVNLEREYLDKLKKVISIRQYAELKRTERAFNQLLISRLNKNNKDDSEQ